MSNLAYYTTDQLVGELIQRETFAGIVIRSPKEVRGSENHRDWDLYHTPNIDPRQVQTILKQFVKQLVM